MLAVPPLVSGGATACQFLTLTVAGSATAQPSGATAQSGGATARPFGSLVGLQI